MHIIRSNTLGIDLYRLKGQLDDPGVAQLGFILNRCRESRTIQFDFSRVDNATGPQAARLLLNVISNAPQGTQLRFSGFDTVEARRHSRAGIPRNLFV